MISSPAINPRLADTDASGTPALRTKDVSGDLVPRPFELDQCIVADSVGSTTAFVTGVHNKDGSNSGLNVVVPAGQNGARIQFPFSGTKLGIYFRRNNNTPSEFTVRVDGVAYAVSTVITKAQVFSQTIEDDLCPILVAENLAEGDHLAEISVVAPAAGSNSILFYGYLVERRAGYTPPTQTQVRLTDGNTPTVDTAIYDTTVSGNGRKVSSVQWHNGTGSSQTVTVKLNSKTIRTLVIADGGFDKIEFVPPIAMNSLWTHSSAGGGATLPYFVLGSY